MLPMNWNVSLLFLFAFYDGCDLVRVFQQMESLRLLEARNLEAAARLEEAVSRGENMLSEVWICGVAKTYTF